MIDYTSAITQQPLLGTGQQQAILGSLAPVSGATAPTAAYPGMLLGSAAETSLNNNYGQDLNMADQTGSVAWQRGYDQDANQLANAQQAAQAGIGVQALGYGQQQEQNEFSRFNQARNFGMSSLDTIAQALGLM